MTRNMSVCKKRIGLRSRCSKLLSAILVLLTLLFGATNSFAKQSTGVGSPSIQSGKQSSTSYMKKVIIWPTAGSLEFRYYVDSEAGYDFLRLFIDGQSSFYESGASRAGRAVVQVPAGVHEIKFQYEKDHSLDRGRDLAWVDDIIAMSPGANGLAETYSFDGASGGALSAWTVGGTYGGWELTNPGHERAMRRPSAHSGIGYQQFETLSGIQGTFLWPSDGYLRFDYYVSSEPCCDFLRVYVDQQKVLERSGLDSSGRESIQVSAGTHTIRFEYRKDTSVDAYLDTALIDNVELGTRGQMFASWSFDNLSPDGVPWGWSGTGYGGGWVVGAALGDEIVLAKHDPSVIPSVDGLINPEGLPKEYVPRLLPTQLRLHDVGMRDAQPAELHIQSSQSDQTLYLAMTFPSVTAAIGDEFGDLRIYIDGANDRTRGAGLAGVDGIAPRQEDRSVSISYDIPSGSSVGNTYVNTLVGNGARSFPCWNQAVAAQTWPVQARVAESPPEKQGASGTMHLEVSIRAVSTGAGASDVFTAGRGGIGVIHEALAAEQPDESLHTIPSGLGRAPLSCDVTTWQPFVFYDPSAATPVRVFGKASAAPKRFKQ